MPKAQEKMESTRICHPYVTWSLGFPRFRMAVEEVWIRPTKLVGPRVKAPGTDCPAHHSSCDGQDYGSFRLKVFVYHFYLEVLAKRGKTAG